LEVWPSVDLLKGKVVRLIKGDPAKMIVYSENPLNTAERWENESVDGLHIIDLDAALGSGNNIEIIKEMIQKSKLPVQVGGGLRSIQDVENLVTIGPCRVIVGTGVLTGQIDHSELLKYGSDKIVVALDHSNGKIVVNGWKKKLDIELQPTLQDLWNLGFRLFLSTNVQKDGTLTGFDTSPLTLLNNFTKQTYVAGGISSLNDIKVLKDYKIRGVVLGRVLYDGIINISDALKVSRNECS
jgi:phosphoribosylformimino-5-aminoimidazole carboxamide ribotide isomerase